MKILAVGLSIICGLFLYWPTSSLANDFFQGEKTVYLVDQEGTETAIAALSFSSEKTGAYSIRLNRAPFEEHFLSMRPFQCLTHPLQMVCYLTYPYENARQITGDSLTDLEYDLLFLHKTPQEYGINAWNGLYYTLSLEADHLRGELREVDLNVLAVPPPAGEMRPVTDDMLYEAEEGAHAFPHLVIR